MSEQYLCLSNKQETVQTLQTPTSYIYTCSMCK